MLKLKDIRSLGHYVESICIISPVQHEMLPDVVNNCEIRREMTVLTSCYLKMFNLLNSHNLLFNHMIYDFDMNEAKNVRST